MWLQLYWYPYCLGRRIAANKRWNYRCWQHCSDPAWGAGDQSAFSVPVVTFSSLGELRDPPSDASAAPLVVEVELLARGKTDAAQKQYLATGSQSDRKTTAATAAARRESASILIERNQFNDAQTALDRLLFEIPVERMALGTGLLKIKLALAQKEFQRASTGCRLLLPVAENEPRQSELLYDTVEASLALGKVDEARQALARLLKNFPYSESAAKAKAQWPQH